MKPLLTISPLFSSMAVDYPLVLYDCHFEGLSWQQEAEEANHVLAALQQHWTQSAVKTHVLLGMIQGLEAIGEKFRIAVRRLPTSYKCSYLTRQE